MNLHDGTRGCKAPIVSGGTQARAVPCKPWLPKQSENKISPLSNENLGLNVGIVVLRKTKLYLDKTIKVESAESTSHTGNSSYKELSVFGRAQGKGEARELPLLPSQSAPSLGALLSMAPAALGVSSTPRSCSSSMLWWPPSPCTSRQPMVDCSLAAHSFSERGLLFVFSWSSSWSYPSTSPGGLVCLSVFAYYKTFGPVVSVIKVRIPRSQEYWSSWHLAGT